VSFQVLPGLSVIRSICPSIREAQPACRGRQPPLIYLSISQWGPACLSWAPTTSTHRNLLVELYNSG
jgi:hypothetical protein